MRLSQISVGVVCCAALSLTACSGTDTPVSPSGTGSSSSEAPGTADPSLGGSTTVSAKAVCDYLRGRLPTLKAIGSEVGAMANLAGNLSSWYGNQGAIPNGTQIDEQTQQECPDVRTEVLNTAGIQSFASL